eukprot:2753956-Rhodomonas_salina.3
MRLKVQKGQAPTVNKFAQTSEDAVCERAGGKRGAQSSAFKIPPFSHDGGKFLGLWSNCSDPEVTVITLRARASTATTFLGAYY